MTKGNVDGRRHQAVSMARREGTPLFNTCLYPYSKNKLSKLASFLLCFMLLSIPLSNVSGQESHDDIGLLLDVHALDSTCLTEETCNSWRAEHFVEYFGADWCEPCREVEEQISQINKSKTVVVSHHPSISDLTFLDQSKLKIDTIYRLLFIPSIVIDGSSLLTGSSQTLEINQVLEKSNTTFGGINDISYNNGTLFWNATGGYNLKVWKLQNTAHEFENYSHPYLATSYLSLDSGNKSANLSSWMANWDGRLVFLLEDPGVVKLTSASSQPTGGMEFNQVDDDNGYSALELSLIHI